ncbi:hypothetical protein P9112_010151 [Eukaryota sp. TZLM1-RC]
MDHPSNSTSLLKNFITGTKLKAAKKDCKIYNAENPQDIDFLKAVAAGDAEKHFIEKILSIIILTQVVSVLFNGLAVRQRNSLSIQLNIQKLISCSERITRKLENVLLVNVKVPPITLRLARGLDAVLEFESVANSQFI